MGDRALCKVCQTYTYEVLEAFRSDNPCPVCGASQNTTIVLTEAENIRKSFQKKSADEELVQINSKMMTENILLKSEVEKLYSQIWSMRTMLDDLYEAWNKFETTVCAAYGASAKKGK